MSRRDPINPTTDDARLLAKDILANTRFGAIAVNLPDGRPYVARVAILADQGSLLTLISTLSTHTSALKANRACAILIGEPGRKGDPLTHPRMTLICQAKQVDKSAHRNIWLGGIPKAKLYYDFTDFELIRLIPSEIHLNGGFGKAFRLSPEDLT